MKQLREWAIQSKEKAIVAAMKSTISVTTGAVLRLGARKFGIAGLSRSNVTTAISTVFVEAATTAYDIYKGRISKKEASIRLASQTSATLTGTFSGALALSIAGPGGLFIGSLTGSTFTTHLFRDLNAYREETHEEEKECRALQAKTQETLACMKKNHAELKKFTTHSAQIRVQTYSFLSSNLTPEADENQFREKCQSLLKNAGAHDELPTFEEFEQKLRVSS